MGADADISAGARSFRCGSIFREGLGGALRGELLCSDATVCWQSNPWKKSTAKMRWKWKKKRQRRLQRKRRKMRARSK